MRKNGLDHIRYSKPVVSKREAEYVREALTQDHIGSDGPFTLRCQQWLMSNLGAPDVRLTHSATAALELAALLAEIGPGDEVVMPSFTFVSCANAVALRGATPVFVDIQPDTLNIDPAAIAAAITDKTRALIVAGVPCDMAAIGSLAARHGLIVIEDAAQALLSSRDGKPVGTFGHLGVFSFHETKNVMSGEGGALIVNDRRFAQRAEVAHRYGTDRGAFDRGERKRYEWIELGSSFAPNEITAALLLAQLERSDEITARRRAMWSRYHDAFAPLESAGLLRRPIVPHDVVHNAHLYYLLLADEAQRDSFIGAMKKVGISTPFHFVPLDTSPGGRRYGRAHGVLTNTHAAAARLVRLPLWFGFERHQKRVIESVLQSFSSLSPPSYLRSR
jgi:dTDP-4-amino-4,6-dideoxygalactose transaminase